MNPLQGLYRIGLEWDRRRTRATKLSYPTLSVGNIAVGGRAKTPLVVEICAALKTFGFHPVVLTRGYARKSREAVWLLPETLPHLQKLSVDDSGDEAVEIFLRAEVPVLIDADRVAQAQKFAQQFKDKKYFFVLDDGFQHWKLARQVDVVVVNDADYQDTLLPTGRLREAQSALGRADLVFHLGRDVQKKMEVSARARGLDPSTTLAVTTRAGSQQSYQKDLSAALGFEIAVLPLRDHLSSRDLREKLKGCAPGIRQLVVGMKEAVKLLAPPELRRVQASYPLRIEGREFEVFVVRLALEWPQEKLKSLLAQKGLL